MDCAVLVVPFPGGAASKIFCNKLFLCFASASAVTFSIVRAVLVLDSGDTETVIILFIFCEGDVQVESLVVLVWFIFIFIFISFFGRSPYSSIKRCTSPIIP